MAVTVLRTDRDHGDARTDGVQERLCRGRPTAVMRDLEHVRTRHAAAEEDRIDPLLDVAHEQERSPAHAELEHDRYVVDARAIVGWLGRDTPRVGPEHAEHSGIDAEAVSRDQAVARLPLLVEQPGEGDVTGTPPRHPGLEEVPDAVAPDEPDESGCMVFVGVREDDDVDAPVPCGHTRIEQGSQAVRVGPAVDQHAPTRSSLDQDRVALPDVEDGDPGPAVGACRRDAAECE